MDDLDDSGLSEDDVDEVIEINEEHRENINDDDDDDDDDEDEGHAGAAGEQIDDDDIDELMESIADDADIVFNKHTGSVFCCALEPTVGQVAVSGGEDDRAFVWNTVTGEVLFQCKDHKDSVTCAAFSHDGTYVATGDMSGVIQVWEMSTKSKIWSFESTDLSWLQWHHSSHVLLSGTIDGNQCMWRMPGGECKIFHAHGLPTDCCKILADGKRAALGYGDGSVRIWDLKTATVLHNIADENGHLGNVTCIDGYHDNTLVMSGSVDGTAKLINSLNGKVLANLHCTPPNDVQAQSSVEAVGFCSNFPVFATATLKGRLSIWDIATQVQRQVCRHDVGIVRLVWDHVSPLVYTVGMDGAVRLWDARGGKMASQWTGHAGAILDVVLSRDGNTILTASDDKSCRVFHVNKPDR